MNNNYLFTAIFWLMLGLQLNGQDQVQLTATNVTTTAGQDACIAVIADSFPDIVSAQFSISWNPNVATFSNTDFGNNPLGLTSANIFSPNDSVLNLSWFQASAVGTTLAPGTTILEICFTPATPNGSTPMSFTGGIIPEFIQEGGFTPFPFTVNDGSFTVSSQSLFVLPGDTNLDSLVNADDVLNIGLAFGQNGAGRNNPQTDFSFQEAPIWPNSTPMSNVNYSHIDTDGNGTINTDDLAVVATNHGQSLSNFTVNAPESGTPSIYATTTSINSGEMASIQLYTGDDTDPPGQAYGIAFSVQIDPAQFDLNTLSVDFNGSFLGDELLTFDAFSPNGNGLLEIAAVRKDQQNVNTISGVICTINVLPFASNTTQTAAWLITPMRYISAQEIDIPLSQATSQISILPTVSTQEPLWAKSLTVSPNPVNNGVINIAGMTNEVASINLQSLHGQQIATYQANNGEIILNNIPSGTYLLQFISGKEVVTRKIVVNR